VPRGGLSPVLERFWSKVDQSGECWEWTGARNLKGYGKFGIRDGAFVAAHRFAYELQTTERIPQGLWVLHRCDNPPCVRQDHLFLGTARDNAQDTIAKGRFVLGYRGRGQDNPCAGLTNAQALEIRNRYDAGDSPTSLALEFGTRKNVVIHIGKRRSWRYLTTEKAS
jgi:HNH endonuclease